MQLKRDFGNFPVAISRIENGRWGVIPEAQGRKSPPQVSTPHVRSPFKHPCYRFFP